MKADALPVVDRLRRAKMRQARQRANAARYRRRQKDKRGQIWVLRTTVRVEPTIDMLVRRRLLPDRGQHLRSEIEAALTALIDDLAE